MELFRFNKPRPFQDQAIADIKEALSNGRSILVSAPTGLGKTDAAISAALVIALEKDLDIFFLTPKISQHRIAVDVLRGVNQKFGLDIKFSDMVGKKNLCTNPDANSIEGEGFYKECEKLIKNGKCPYYSAFKNLSDDLPEEIIEASARGHNSLFDSCFKHGICAYEAAAQIAKYSKVIIADYAHLLNPSIRNSFMKKIAHKLSGSIVIWDEAHNIIDLASKYLSSTLSTNTLRNAEKELHKIGSNADLGYLRFAIEKLAKSKLASASEAFVDKEDLPIEIRENIEGIEKAMVEKGLEYIEKAKARHSSLMHIAKFLELWDYSGESFVRIITKSNKRVTLSIVSLYPESTANIFKEAYANVFMSATLSPLSMYKELFNLGDAEAKQYGAAFPESNKAIFIDDTITTKYEYRSIEEYRRIAQKIIEIKHAIDGNIAVFFPSFDVLENAFRYITKERVFRQRRSMSNIELENMLESFRKSTNSILMGVMGGSLSEGVDYPGNVIKGVVIVGVPLAKPTLETKARISYYEKKFQGKGIEYAYIMPAVIKGIQAAGRAIRSESDRAVVVFMDKRYRWRIYYPIMSGKIIKIGGDYISDIKRFWELSKSQISVAPK
ncbi:MAG: ATP-dependent DNA helicase [Candidatus Micrarchaeia archaeon]